MYIEGSAIILKASKFQESSIIIECFSRERGVLKGVIKARKTVQAAVPGTLVHLIFKARLDSHLGTLQIEPIRTYLSLVVFDRLRLKLLNCALLMCAAILHERDAHPNLYDALLGFLEALTEESHKTHILKLYALLELKMMEEAGYGLDLSKCVVTNDTTDLAYISPKSGCAVSGKAGKAYHDKLFKMPPFYLDNANRADANQGDRSQTDLELLKNALKLNKFFLHNRIFEPNNMRIIEERYELECAI